ncbi:hypothetical protein [Williamwhitmania taraxaci]|uniref:hypothetical protein n=1 Tax=Williamwhitmania taraxaci TaxID=1640674 RepID=UPI000B85AF99|nr:hypothetical protein [Williamwhitmania taraxaci]
MGDKWLSTCEKVIITGINAYVRDLLFLTLPSAIGLVFLFHLGFLLILAILILIYFYFVAKWEEREFAQRFVRSI